jgi:LmbE family N-acetylglucosaminyl deacetylase
MLLVLTTAARAQSLSRFDAPVQSDRVLVIAPHPDDETLCCAGFMQRALAAGAEVGVVWITAGDGSRRQAWLGSVPGRMLGKRMVQLGEQRISEGRAAVAAIGVPGIDAWMLGYPDRGISRLLDPASDRPYRSLYTRTSTVPYPEAVSPSARVTGRQLEEDLRQIVTQFRPTLIIAPSAADQHPDHRASGLLAQEVQHRYAPDAGLACYVVHAGSHWPPRGLKPDQALPAAPALRGLAWQAFELSPSEREAKAAALREHHSQMRVMAGFLNSFVRSNELFAAAACQPRS